MDQKVTLIDKNSHQGVEVNASDKIQLSAQNPSVVQLKISSEDIKEYKKEGNNLVVVLKSGELITIMGFFDADNSLVLQDDVNHKLLWVEFSSNGEVLSSAYAELNDVGPLLYGENDAASPWAWAAVPLTAGGILAWAGHDSGNDSDKAIGETNEGPSAPESVVIGNGDEWITADEIDADGKVDVTIDLPVDAVAGDSVIVNGEETVLTADDIAAGEIIVKVDVPNEGETLEVEVSIKDAAGNESDEILVEAAVDSVLPVVEIEAVTPIDSDNPADGVADQVLITGTSDEPNAPVVIKDKDGNTIWEGMTDDTGAFSATVDTAAVQAGDDVTVEVTDKAGNTGTDTATAGDLTFSPDSTDPIVEIDAVTPIDSDNPADGIADQVLITGTSDEPNAPVVIKDKDGNTIWEGETDGTGAFSATVDTAAVQAGDDVTVEVTDKAGNTGTDTATAGDLTFSPDSTDPIVEIEAVTPIDSDNPADGVADQVLITGTSDEPNAPVVIKDKDGNTIWEGMTDDTGAFSATVDTAAVQAGDDVTVEVTDKAGNTGTDTATAGDLTFSPDSTDPIVEIDAVTPIDSDNPADGIADQVLITGTSDEPNAPVVIKDKDGNTIWEGETDGTGAFSATVDTAAVQAGDDVTVEVTDKAGNTGTDTATAGDLIFINDPLVLVDDTVSTSLVDQSVDTTNKLATYNEGAILGILEGQSQIGKVNFDVTGEAKDAVIVVESTNLVTVANAFSFEVVNNATGEVFTVAAASSSQGGLIAGALGLQALGVVDDGSGLRLDIKDLPEGNYSVIVHGDSSKLADILETVKLSELGSNTVNDVIQDTVKGLVKDVLVNADDTVLEGILEQLTLQEVLDLAKTTNVSTALINTLETLLDTVDSVLSFLNPFGNNTAVAAELLNTSVGDILAGNSTGLLGNLISALGLGATLSGLVNGLLDEVDNLGEVIYNEVVEPLIDDVIADTLLQDTGLADLLGGLLGGINQILNGLGLGGLLPAADGLLTIVAENILSNPVSLFPDVTADVYAVNEKTYVAEGNVLANDDVVNGSITKVNGNSITFDQTDINGKYTIITGTHGILHLYEDGHYIYTSTVTSGNATSVVDNFTYTVQDEYNNTEDAFLTITTDPVNETIDFSGTDSDDILQGGAGDDILTGGDGADTAIYYLLNNADATGGNGTDTWTDFELGADADKIDISALLDGLQTSANIGDYISIETNADGKAVISIDRNGSDNSDGFTSKSDLLVLDNISPADLNLTNDELLNNLLSNNQIVY